MSVPKLRFPGFNGDWRLMRLGNRVTKVGSGVTPKGGAGVYQSEGIPLIRSQNVRDSKLDLSDVAFISGAINDTMRGSAVFPNDVLLNITGASIGRSCVVPENIGPANVNQHVCIIRLDQDGSPHFLQLFLASHKGQKLIAEAQSGSGREGLNFENIRTFKLAFPALPEQQKIAAFLGAADAKLAALAAKQAALGRFKAGLMQKLFSQQLRFTRDDGTAFPDWEEKRLGTVASIRAGDFVSASNISAQQHSGLFRCYGGNGLRGYVTTFNREGRYSLIGRQGALCGNVHFVDGRFHATEHALVAEASDMVVPEWLFFLLDQMQLNQYATGLAQPGISAEIVKNLRTSIPSCAEQTKIATALSAMDKKIQAVADQVAKLQTFKKGLLQQMFV